MKLFVALAETLHFGHAAARMNMTQPPFSRQIANLERDLGAQLVERSSRHVRLTSAGQRFYEESLAVLARFDRACRDARRVAEGQTGELKLGFMMHAAHRLVPDLLVRFTRQHPDVRVVLHEATPGEIEDRLTGGDLDVGITFEGRNAPHLTSVLLMQDRLCLIAAPGHPLGEKQIIQPDDLAGVPLIAAPAAVAPVLRSAISDYVARAGRLASFQFEPQLQNTIMRLVAVDLGVALVPESICEGRSDDLVMRPLAEPPTLEIVAKARSDNSNPALTRFLDVVAEM